MSNMIVKKLSIGVIWLLGCDSSLLDKYEGCWTGGTDIYLTCSDEKNQVGTEQRNLLIRKTSDSEARISGLCDGKAVLGRVMGISLTAYDETCSVPDAHARSVLAADLFLQIDRIEYRKEFVVYDEFGSFCTTWEQGILTQK